MSQWGAVIGRLSLLTQEFLCTEGRQPCCCLSYPPHPPKQIECLIQTRPWSAPQPKPLSGPQGTMPTVIRRQHCWSNTETQVEPSYFIQRADELLESGFNGGIGCLEQLIQIIRVLENIQTYMHIGNAEDKRNEFNEYTEANKGFSRLCLIMSESWTHKKSA